MTMSSGYDADERMKTPNRLISEKSPYLLQHAYNPVNWYPWGTEAFEDAVRETKPVFLSVGYSTCHWCHVMERESFEDDEAAGMLNEAFISIKVDREERRYRYCLYEDQIMTAAVAPDNHKPDKRFLQGPICRRKAVSDGSDTGPPARKGYGRANMAISPVSINTAALQWDLPWEYFDVLFQAHMAGG
jgi:hypothetical protein